MSTEFKRIEIRAGTPGSWSAANPILTFGEPGAAINPGGTIRLKIGDGVTAWNSLPYVDATAIAALAGYVLKSGDTMSGNLTIVRNGAAAILALDSDAGQFAEYALLTDGSFRWVMHKNNDAEVGGNAGSHLDWVRFTDGGVANGIVMRMYRDSGIVDFPIGLNTGGTPAPGSDNVQVPNTIWVNDNIPGRPISFDRALLATAVDQYITGRNIAAGELQVGAHFRVRIGLTKTAAVANLTATIRYGITATVAGDPAIGSIAYAGSTAAVDTAVLEFDVHVDTINAATGTITVVGAAQRNGTTTGFSATDNHPVTLSQTATLDTTALRILGVSILASVANVVTILFINIEKIART